MDDIRLLIVADDPLARAGLATLLADQPGCAIVGRISGETDVLAELDIYQPDALLWDLGWDPALVPPPPPQPAAPAPPERGSSLERLADVQSARADLPIVALLPDEEHAAEAWHAGARGLLLRDTTAEQLLAALQAVNQGLVSLDPVLMSALAEAWPDRSGQDGPLLETLTPRELEVLQLLAEGLPNKAIALRLDISEHTVKFHVNAILGKLNAQSRTEAVVRATRLGLLRF